MRFIVMHKMTAEMEKGAPPDPEIVEGVGRLLQEGLSGAVFLSGEGLKPTRERLHVAYRGGARTVTEAPFNHARELVGGFAMLVVRSREEALAACDRLAAAMGDVELFLGPVVEPWDIGMAPRPEDPPMRFLALTKIDAATEAGAKASPMRSPEVKKVIAALGKAGVVTATGTLASTQKGARVRFDGGKRAVIDGPFAESKELIAGYAILELPSKEAAVAWAVKFRDVVRVDEVEVRELVDEPDA